MDTRLVADSLMSMAQQQSVDVRDNRQSYTDEQADAMLEAARLVESLAEEIDE